MLIVDYIWDHITQYMMTICMGNTHTFEFMQVYTRKNFAETLIHKNHLKKNFAV